MIIQHFSSFTNLFLLCKRNHSSDYMTLILLMYACVHYTCSYMYVCVCVCTYRMAASPKRLSGCCCRRTWRSPPGQNSVNKQDRLGESNVAYNVGKNGCSNISNISLSILALLSLFLVAISFLSMTLAAKRHPLPSLSSTRYTLPMSPLPNLWTKRKSARVRGELSQLSRWIACQH
jgi:hypothetical protein